MHNKHKCAFASSSITSHTVEADGERLVALRQSEQAGRAPQLGTVVERGDHGGTRPAESRRDRQPRRAAKNCCFEPQPLRRACECSASSS